MEQRVPVKFEEHYSPLDLWTQVTAYPTSTGGIAIFFRDIADRKQVDIALRDSEERYRSLFDSIDEGFCIVEVLFGDGSRPIDYRFIDVNLSFVRQTGIVNGAGKRMRELAPSHEEHWFETYGRVALTGEPIRFQNRAEALGRWYDVYAFRVGEPERRLVAILFNDITDRKRSDDALRDADRRKDEFLGILSHELRNPLAPIRSSVFILSHADPNGAQARRARAIIRRQTDHLTRLVDDLLDVTRIARGKIELRRERIDLAEVVRRASEDYRAVMVEQGVRLVVDAPDESVWIHADVTRIAQVIGNLLLNAAKFTPAGGTATLSLEARESTAEIRVSDTGVGIEPELLASVFEPFIQSDRTLARTQGGLGLGLALVKSIVELHGGTVRAESAGVGNGAEFALTLPLAGARDPVEAVPVADCVGDVRRRVLVVDDNQDAAESLAELVQMFGHAVEVVHDGPTAVAMVRANTADVVLCDIGLPGMDGYEVARQIRAGENRDVRLIAVTGYAQLEDLERAAAAGFDGHVAKPADPVMIQRLLERRR